MRIVQCLLLVLLAPPALAQEAAGPPGPRILLPRDQEVALARSAAPKSVSGAARVWVLVAGRFVVADSGSSSVECYVSRSWPESLEPHCFDEEGARTIMRIGMRKVELAHAGVTNEDARAEIASGLATGALRLPQRPAMSWMQSAAQVLYSDDGRRVGAWRPHVMIYFPYLTADGLGLAGMNVNAGMVVNPGSPMSNLMILVPEAVTPEAHDK